MNYSETMAALKEVLDLAVKARVDLWESDDHLGDVSDALDEIQTLARRLQRSAKKNRPRACAIAKAVKP